MTYVDGNVLAGPLAEVFGVDFTAVTGTCASCGFAAALATLRVYSTAPGFVARCPSCEEVVLRLVRTPTEAWVDLRGARSLRVPLT
ncbi:DUF6510 family protein [Labedaea rhizosphaerae]|uniref:Uncharacterized protein n=1 Tax=Labedaea rhizosphaerae TaxID=598644 RepID=A0A4R6SKU3_LABRH|nr:DUF6510 family protein [Labedaea rhizosphaerae]TDQ01579.1 hypothetical protein EV186_1021448 [Labedaea rhizosphaerae]